MRIDIYERILVKTQEAPTGALTYKTCLCRTQRKDEGNATYQQPRSIQLSSWWMQNFQCYVHSSRFRSDHCDTRPAVESQPVKETDKYPKDQHNIITKIVNMSQLTAESLSQRSLNTMMILGRHRRQFASS